MIRHVAIFPEEATENNKKSAPHEQCTRGGFGLNGQFALQKHPSFGSLALWENRLVLAY
jgi:hypothetical protein